MTKIEWCEESWNPIVGCSLVSPGCTNCYAMKQAARNVRMHFGQHARAGDGAPFEPSIYAGLTQDSKAGPVWTGKVAMVDNHALTKPLRWKRPREIFVNSMGDLFHESVPDAWIDRVFAVMALAPHHQFIVLTKRAKRMREYCSDPETPERVIEQTKTYGWDVTLLGAFVRAATDRLKAWPLPNVYLGVSAEDQSRADERIPDLLATPAAGRFVSAEPLLGPLELRAIDVSGDGEVLPLGGAWLGRPEYENEYGGQKLDGVIVGGEKGPGARPGLAAWRRSIRDQCAAAGVAYFEKQWGEWIDADEWLRHLETPCNRVMAGDRRLVSPLNFEDAKILAGIGGYRFEHQSDGSTMIRVGKARAGRLLDGREHNDLPWRPA
jgi:protein gp37